jgi:hypothetical protein
MVMGPKGRPDTKTNWPTVCRPQEETEIRLFLSSHLLARWFLPGMIFDSDDGGVIFLQNVCSYTD